MTQSTYSDLFTLIIDGLILLRDVTIWIACLVLAKPRYMVGRQVTEMSIPKAVSVFIVPGKFLTLRALHMVKG